jgi:hypothetical protein
MPIVTTSLISLAYNLFRAVSFYNLSDQSQQSQEYALTVQVFTNNFMGLFNIYDDYLDIILLIVWSATVVSSTFAFFEIYEDLLYHDVIYYLINYGLAMLMFLSCIVRMITKRYKDNSHQSGDYEALNSLLDEYDAKLIDDSEVNKLIDVNEEKLIDIDTKDEEIADVKLIDVDVNEVETVDVKFIEPDVYEGETADVKFIEPDVVDVKLVDVDLD